MSVVDRHQALALYEQMVMLREFDRLCERLTFQNKFPGSIHIASGQEAIAVGVCATLRADDVIAITYRGRGQALAKGCTPEAVLAEMMGRAGGTSRGKAGAMHIGDMSRGVLLGNAIVAAGIPIAAGVALAAKLRGEDRVVVAFFGDGATNQGVFYETLNMAALWSLPVIFCCENNQYAEMTHVSHTMASKSLGQRAAGMGIPVVEIDGNDLDEVISSFTRVVEQVRGGAGPVFVEAATYRLSGHMVGDPNTYRSKDELTKQATLEPILRYQQRLTSAGMLTDELIETIHARVNRHLEEALTAAEASPLPDPEEAFHDVYTDPVTVSQWS